MQQALIYLSAFSVASATNHADLVFWEKTEEPLTFIKNYLLEVESWTLFELHVFANSLIFFPISLTSQLMERALLNLAPYRDFQGANRLLAVTLINFISQLTEENEWAKVDHFLPALKDITDTIELSFERIAYLFFEAALDYVATNDASCLKQLDQCIAMMSLLDHPKFTHAFISAKADLLTRFSAS